MGRCSHDVKGAQWDCQNIALGVFCSDGWEPSWPALLGWRSQIYSVSSPYFIHNWDLCRRKHWIRQVSSNTSLLKLDVSNILGRCYGQCSAFNSLARHREVWEQEPASESQAATTLQRSHPSQQEDLCSAWRQMCCHHSVLLGTSIRNVPIICKVEKLEKL